MCSGIAAKWSVKIAGTEAENNRLHRERVEHDDIGSGDGGAGK